MAPPSPAAPTSGHGEAAAIRRYVESLGARRGGRRASAESLQHRIQRLKDQTAAESNLLRRLALQQKLIDAEQQLASLDNRPSPAGLEAGFVTHAKSYSDRKGISHAAWRASGVPAAVLKAAGIRRRS